MAKVLNYMEMEIIIKASLSTECLKGTDSIHGMMGVNIRAISNRVSLMDMDFGTQVGKGSNLTKGTMLWIKNVVMVFTLGTMVGSIKVISKMIKETALDNCIKMITH